MSIDANSGNIPNPQQDLGLSVSQKQTEKETADPTKVGQATRVGELETGEGGKTTATYNVKMTMPDGTSKSYKIRVGFNDAQLRQHIQKTGGDGAELANVIDRIVDSMDAASIAKLSGHQVSSRLNEWDKATVTMKGGEQKTIAELKSDSNPERQSLGSSASKVINAFKGSAIGQTLNRSASATSSRSPPPTVSNGPPDQARESDRQTRSASQSGMTARSSNDPGGEPVHVEKYAAPTKQPDTSASRKPLPPTPNRRRDSEPSSKNTSSPVGGRERSSSDPLTPPRPLQPPPSLTGPPKDPPQPVPRDNQTNPPQSPMPQRPSNLPESASDSVGQGQSSSETKGKDDLGRVNPRTSDIGGDVEDLDSPVIHLAVTEESTPKDSPLLTSSNQSPTSPRKRSMGELKKAAVSGSSDMEASGKAVMQLLQDKNVLEKFDSAISSNQKDVATKTKIPSENYVEVVDAIMNLESHNLTEISYSIINPSEPDQTNTKNTQVTISTNKILTKALSKKVGKKAIANNKEVFGRLREDSLKFVAGYSSEYAKALEMMPTRTPTQRMTLLNQIVKARETAASYDSAVRQFELTEDDRGAPDVSGIVFNQDSHSDYVGISAAKRDELSSKLDGDLISQKAELESSEPEQENKIRDEIGNTMARQALLNNNGDFNAARDFLTAAKGDSSEVENLDSAIKQLDQIQEKEMKRQVHTTQVLDEIFNTEDSYFAQVFSLTEKTWGPPPDTNSMNIFERMEHEKLISPAESKLLQAHWDEITEQSARTLCDLAETTYNDELKPELNVANALGKHKKLTPEQKLKGQVHAMRTERQKTVLMQMSTASIKQKQSGEILERVGKDKKGAALIQAFSELGTNKGMNPNAKIIGPTQRGPRYKLLSDEIKKASPENAKELLNNQNEHLVSNMKIFNSFIPR